MIVEFEGKTWEMDPSKLRVQQGFVIQAYTGMSIGDWQDSLGFEADEDGNLKNPPAEWLKSVVALYWLMLAQNGVQTPIADVDFEVEAFLTAFMKAMVAEVEKRKAESQPDPTSPPPSPGGPPSSVPAIPTVTTLPPPVLQGGGLAIAST